MIDVELRATAGGRSVEAVEDGRVVGVIHFDEAQCEWIAETEDLSLTCLSFEDAASFVKAVREPITAVKVLYSPM